MKEVINYLIHFLAGESRIDLSSIIGYTADEKLFPQYKIVIVPSSFFNDDTYGKKRSIPKLPLEEINGIPLLFGTPRIEKTENTLVVHADIIASSYFLLTRYEEWIRTEIRDVHDRFPGKESLPSQADFLHRPIVDEYGILLQNWLKESGVNITKAKKQISKIYLTHDIDQITQYRTLRGFLSGLFRSITLKEKELKTALISLFGKVENDPLYVFPWILKKNDELKEKLNEINVETVFFFKSLISYLPQDKPYYDLFSKDAQSLFKLCSERNVEIGLHASYLSADNPELILSEKDQLKIAFNNKIRYNRHHYLRSKDPSDMNMLIEAGITDDFTMGYADVSGFRLGTCKPVKWIDPQTKKISTLTLHHLSIMDRTLEDERYMSLDYTEALNYSKKIIDKVHELNGELVLLWHNTGLSKVVRFSQKKLYSELLNYITQISKNE